jgi:hypothetical protein
MALTKLTSNLIEGGTGTDWVTAIQTSNFTAEAGKGYFVNTTSQTLYVNLPVGVVGMEITIQDYAGTFATNKVILNANGSEKIQGLALEGKITTNNATAVLIYQDATKGWTSQDVRPNITEISWTTPTGQSLTYSTPSPQSSSGTSGTTFPTTTFTATLAGSTISGTATIAGLPSGITAAQTITGSGAGNTLTVTLTGTFPAADSSNTALTLSGLIVLGPPITDFLVIAGGGNSPGYGGGGAGGLRTSYGSLSGGGGSSESNVTFVVATNYSVTVGAGAPIATSTASKVKGNNSILSIPGGTITSLGGGSAGGPNGAGGSALTDGGSGGGYSNNWTDGNRAGGAGTVNQGYAGGSAQAVYGADGGSGGGGAGGVGVNRNGSSGSDGGPGLSVSITGAAVIYAGGGGGGPNASPGAGQNNPGGGGTGPSFNGTAGKDGIVILRYQTGYTITNPGGGLNFTTAVDGSYSVTSITAGTGNIQFN